MSPITATSPSTPDAEGTGPATLTQAYAHVWWLPLLRGIVLVLTGLLLLVQPLVASAGSVAALYAVFLVVDAAVAASQGAAARGQVGQVWWFVQAIVGVLFAALVVFWPGVTALVLYYVVASWAVVRGVVVLITGVNVARARDAHWPWVSVAGIVGVLFGLILLARPPDGGTALSLVVAALGLFVFVLGACGIVSAFAARAQVADIDAALGGTSLALEEERNRAARLAAARSARGEEKTRLRVEHRAAKEREKAERKAARRQRDEESDISREEGDTSNGDGEFRRDPER